MAVLTAAIRVATIKLGYKELKPSQELAVRSLVDDGRDVFVSLPTGSGKSLCFCVLPGVFDEIRKSPGSSLVIVVSPLVALMKDQVKAMTDRGASAVYVGDCDEKGFNEISDGRKQLLYMSPCSQIYNGEILFKVLYSKQILLSMKHTV